MDDCASRADAFAALKKYFSPAAPAPKGAGALFFRAFPGMTQNFLESKETLYIVNQLPPTYYL
jgi:hypothetical protein